MSEFLTLGRPISQMWVGNQLVPLVVRPVFTIYSTFLYLFSYLPILIYIYACAHAQTHTHTQVRRITTYFRGVWEMAHQVKVPAAKHEDLSSIPEASIICPLTSTCRPWHVCVHTLTHTCTQFHILTHAHSSIHLYTHAHSSIKIL